MNAFKKKYKYFSLLSFVGMFLLTSCNKDTTIDIIYPHVNITSITPNSGATDTVITIIGNNFSPNANNNNVTINGVPLIIKSATTDTIRAIITDGVKTGRVVVSTNTLPDFYGPIFTRIAVQSKIQIFSIAPDNGATDSVITITGSNFSPIAPNNKVTINGVPLIVKSATPNTIIAVITDSVKTGHVVIGTNILPEISGPVFTRTYNTDYYFAGIDYNKPVYWKNGKEYFLPFKDTVGYVASMAILGKDIYMGGGDGKSATYWKNGIEYQLPINSKDGSFVSEVKVIGSDVYLIGEDGRSPAFWKNGIEYVLNYGFGGSLSSMAISGSDLYFSGNDGPNPAYWKNGVEQILPSPIKLSNASWASAGNVQVLGSDFYICGVDGYQAVYWKNGVENLLPYNSPSVRGSQAETILISNNNVYIGGFDGHYIVYWKNNIEIELPHSGGDGDIGAIMTYGSDLYISGADGNYPAYWKNGIETILPRIGFYASAVAMLIVSN